MDQIKLCEKINGALRHIIIDDGEKVISAGTGTIINEKGYILTAKHVVAYGGSFYPGKLIVTSPKSQVESEYTYFSDPNLSIKIDLPDLLKPIEIDLAILKPKKDIQTNFLELYDGKAPVGTDVLLAGFPDDVDVPLNFVESFNLMNPDMTDAKKVMDKRFIYYMRQPLFKKGMIGSMLSINIDAPAQRIKIDGASYTIDTELTYGGSGGPIVNMEGKLLGVIIRKGFTSAKKLEIQHKNQGIIDKLPSGTGFGLSHHLITGIYRWGCRFQNDFSR
jgi:hypothetical protein